MNKKIIFKSIIATLLLSSISLSATSYKDIEFNKDNLKIDNNIRFGYLLDRNTINGTSYDNYDFSSGGEINLNYAINSEFEFKSSVYFNKSWNEEFGVAPINLNGELSAYGEGSEYIYIGEAYMSYQPFYDTNVMVGYQSFNMPFFNAHDNRMTKNSFEAIAAEYIGIENMYFSVGYINRMAGKDVVAGTISNSYEYMFNNVNIEAGRTAFANVGIKVADITTNLFYSNIDQVTDMYYLTMENTQEFGKNISLDIAGEFSYLSEINKSGYTGMVYGGKGVINYNKYKIGFAYDKSSVNLNDNIYITKGISPYYTTSQLYSIDMIKEDATAYRFTAALESKIKNKKFTTEFSYSYYISDITFGTEITEIDLLASYNYNDNISLDLFVSDVINENVANTDSLTVFTRINVKF